MVMQGWIKLHRKLLASDVFQNEKLLKVFIYCLLKATHSNYSQKVGRQTVELKPGQFIYGRRKAALELNMKESTVRDYMNILKDDGVITISPTNKYSVVTIVNWELYQGVDEKTDNKNDNESDNKPTTKGQQKDTNKNDKNEENINVVVDIDPDGFYERALKQKYMQLGAVRGIDLPPSDINAIHQVIASGVPIHKALELLEECFANYKPKHPRDKINSFSYCATYILNRYFREKEGANSGQNNRRSTSRTTKQDSKPKEEPIFGDYVGRLPRRNKIPVP